jgi:hypothetical protein
MKAWFVNCSIQILKVKHNMQVKLLRDEPYHYAISTQMSSGPAPLDRHNINNVKDPVYCGHSINNDKILKEVLLSMLLTLLSHFIDATKNREENKDHYSFRILNCIIAFFLSFFSSFCVNRNNLSTQKKKGIT